MALSRKIDTERGAQFFIHNRARTLGDRAYALIDQETGKVASAKNPRKWGKLFDFRAAFIEDPSPPQEVEDLSKYIAKNEIKDMTLLLRKEYTLSSFLDTIESWLRVSGFPYRRDEDITDNHTHTFVIQHDMGKRWSMYFDRLFKYVFEELNLRKYSFDNTDNSVTFKIQVEE